MRRVLLIVNPRAGGRRGPRVAERAAAELARRGFELERRLTERPGHARQLAAALDPARYDALGVVGGDGTVHEVANGLLEHGPLAPPVALLPAGSGDSLARHLGIRGWRQGVASLVASRARPIELARVELDGRRRYALNLVGWGAVARIDHRAERLRWSRRLRYDLATLIELARPRLPRGGFALDGGPDAAQHLGGAVCVTRFIGNGIELAPDARLDDGKLDLVQLRAAPRARLLALLLAVKTGRARTHPLLERRQLARLELRLAPGSPVVLDGEPLRATHLTIEAAPAALKVFAP